MGNDLADFLLDKFNEKENIQVANKQRNNELVRASEDLIQEIEQWLSSAVENREFQLRRKKSIAYGKMKINTVFIN